MYLRVRSEYKGVFEGRSAGRPIAPEYTTFAKAWGWYKTIDDLAGGAILDYDKITGLPITAVLTNLQYRKDKEYAEDAQRKLDKFIAKNKNANS